MNLFAKSFSLILALMFLGSCQPVQETPTSSSDDSWSDDDEGVDDFEDQEDHEDHESESDVVDVADTSESTILMDKIQDLEEKLKKYGFHFKVDKRTDYNSSGTNTVISVGIVENSSEDDLRTLGLDPAGKMILLKELADLSAQVKELDFLSSNNQDKMAAGMKVNLVRSQILLPEALDTYLKAVSLQAASPLLKFEKINSVDQEFWATESISTPRYSNRDALLELQQLLVAHEAFEKAKKDFFIEYLEDQKRSYNLSNRRTTPLFRQNVDRIGQGELIQVLEKVVIYSMIPMSSLDLVKSAIEALAIAEEGDFDIAAFEKQNKEVAHSLLATKEAKVATAVAKLPSELKISWLENTDFVGGKESQVMLNVKDLAAARVRMPDFEARYTAIKNEVIDSQRAFSRAAQDLEQILGERVVLSEKIQQKVDAVLAN